MSYDASTPGVAGLRLAALAWLRSDDDVDELLGEAGGVEPTAMLEGAHPNDAINDLDPRVLVATSRVSSTRDNLRVDGLYQVRAIVDATQAFVERNGDHHLVRLKDRVADVLETHHEGWHAEGIDSDAEIAYNSDVGRHFGALEASFARRDMAAPNR